MVDELGRLEDISPTAIASVLFAILQTYQPAFDFEERLKKLVEAGHKAARPETRRDALRCVDRLRFIPGMVQLYAQLVESKPAAES
jgi:hypothetical protein